MKKLLLILLLLLLPLTAQAAYLVSGATGNAGDATKWYLVDQSQPNLTGTAANVASNAIKNISFTPSASNNFLGIALRTTATITANTTLYVNLQQNITAVWTNVSNQSISSNLIQPNSWFLYKPDAVFAVDNTVRKWRVQVSSNSTTASTFATFDNANLTFLEVLDTTQIPAANDHIWIMGYGNVTTNQVAITQNLSQTYGNNVTTPPAITIGQNGTWDNAGQAANYTVTLVGDFIVNNGFTRNITVPSDKTFNITVQSLVTDNSG
jgi:hypothetical protein